MKLRRVVRRGPGLFFLLALPTIVLALTAWPCRYALAAPQNPEAFHIAEITKILVGYNGDTDIQAVEIKMTASGENFVSGMQIAVYDSLGSKLSTLGTFSASVPNGLNGDNILCATVKFRDGFGIVPDLLITPGILVRTGQVAYEMATCRVNAIPYGGVVTPLTSPTAAPPLPAGGATALARTFDTPTFPTCPLAENAAARFELRSGSSGSPLVFRNNARDTTQVWTTVSAVEGDAPPAPRILAAPNPFRESTRLEFPSEPGRVSVYDVRGRRLRVWDLALSSSGPRRHYLEWDGRDGEGRPLPSGLYLVEARLAREHATARTRVLLLR